MDENRPVRDQLLDAAYQLTVRWGWAKVRMADVAKASGFSRQTIYDQFGSREELARELAMRELDDFLDGIEAAMDGERDVAAAVEAATRFALEAGAANPLVRGMIADPGSEGMLPLAGTYDEPIVLTARSRLHDYLLARFVQLDDETADLLAEVGARLVMSYVVLCVEPPELVAARLRSLVTRMLQPVPS